MLERGAGSGKGGRLLLFIQTGTRIKYNNNSDNNYIYDGDMTLPGITVVWTGSSNASGFRVCSFFGTAFILTLGLFSTDDPFRKGQLGASSDTSCPHTLQLLQAVSPLGIHLLFRHPWGSSSSPKHQVFSYEASYTSPSPR